ncbi:MAG: hypothetical protein ACI4EG_10700 [Fusicatenibacter sp.]|nr:hypothetical protein [Fusicatenibacter sp.]
MICAIIGIVSVMLLVLWSLCSVGSKEKELEDLEQEEYLKQWAKQRSCRKEQRVKRHDRLQK